jgi:hypothetical protein
MKKSTFSGLALTLLAFSPLLATAATDPKYPAANFEPTVIFIDKEVATKAGEQNDGKCAPTNVAYNDKALAAESEAKFDPKFPAAYFTPKVIYP